MSAIAHHLEKAGIATALVALIRPHAERARPPRALWVPFQLGRPVGPPLNARFQTRVLRTLLALLERNDGPPILADFEEDEPGAADVPGWSPPDGLAASRLEEEVAALESWYRQSQRNTGRTSVGVSSLNIATVADYLARVDSDRPAPKPRRDLSDVQILRYAADDLKAYYLEAILAAAGPGSADQISDWFWRRTVAGRLLNDLRERSLEHPDLQRRYAAWWLVPDRWSETESVQRMQEIAYAP